VFLSCDGSVVVARRAGAPGRFQTACSRKGCAGVTWLGPVAPLLTRGRCALDGALRDVEGPAGNVCPLEPCHGRLGRLVIRHCDTATL